MFIFHSLSSLKSALGFWVVFKNTVQKKKCLDVVSHCSSVSVVDGSRKAAALLITILGHAVAPFFLPWLLS